MAIRSALTSYIINEERDGFVAVDFDFINQEDHHDLTAWEFVDQVDADVDDCSSIGQVSDDVSDIVGFVRYDAETVAGSDVESSPEYLVGEGDDDDGCSSIGVKSDDVSGNFGFAGSLVSDMLEECASESSGGGDAKSVPETIISPEYSDENIGNGDSKPAAESIMSPEYSEETIAGHDESFTPYRSLGEKYCYEEEELEEDDYDLDDELVPYCVNDKLGRDRMRKLGKRSCAKSVKTKRLTYNYNKAGCVRGKHGLGLKHSLM